MVETLARNWWAIAIRGVAAILFGLCALLIPGAALWALVILFGAYCLVDGVFEIVASVRAAQAHERWGQLLAAGILGIIAAAITWFDPAITAFALVFIIAAWAIVTGVLQIIAGIELRRFIQGEAWWIVAGLLSVAFGALLIWRPGSGALAVIWIIGIYAIAYGIMLLGVAFRLRGYLHVRTPAPA